MKHYLTGKLILSLINLSLNIYSEYFGKIFVGIRNNCMQ